MTGVFAEVVIYSSAKCALSASMSFTDWNSGSSIDARLGRYGQWVKSPSQDAEPFGGSLATAGLPLSCKNWTGPCYGCISARLSFRYCRCCKQLVEAAHKLSCHVNLTKNTTSLFMGGSLLLAELFCLKLMLTWRQPFSSPVMISSNQSWVWQWGNRKVVVPACKFLSFWDKTCVTHYWSLFNLPTAFKWLNTVELCIPSLLQAHT